MNESIFLDHLKHAYMQTNGTYKFPNSREGDMLKQAKKELETAITRINKACDELESLRDIPETPIPIPDNLPQIDNILFDLEGGEESFTLELSK